MAEEVEKKLQKVLDKLYHFPKPKPKPKPKPSPSSGGMSSLQKGKRVESSWRGNFETVPKQLNATVGSKEVAAQECRPWYRGDLMRRLVTFKAMTWFGKPKAVSPVNCARRGWINVEIDTIACEACGARLLFSTSSTWTLQQVEKAAAVFSLKLDNGHKLPCPWIDNICDETLALFPPTPAPALVEGYKDRFSALRRLSALPIVSSSAIDLMRSRQLEHFLAQSSSTTCILDNGIRLSDSSRSEELDNTSKEVTASLYYQAQKIISLCGWEPRVLPYVVDRKDQTSQSAKNAHRSEYSVQSLKSYHSSIGTGAVGEETNNHPPLEHESDPASVVLDCGLCGACVGLWAFTVIPRPLEHFSLIESPDASIQNVSATCGANPSSRIAEASSSDIFGTGYHNTDKEINHRSNFTASNERSLSLNLAIGGGPPPEKQNFIPSVSLPIVSRHLRPGVGSKSDVGNHSSSTDINQLNTQCSTKGNDASNQQDDVTGSFLEGGSESVETLKRKRDEDECCISRDSDLNSEPNQIGENSIDCIIKGPDDLGRSDEFSHNIENGESLNPDMEAGIIGQVGGSPCTTADTNVTIAGAETCEKVLLKELSSVDNQHDSVLPGVNSVTYQNENNSSHTKACSESNANVNNTCEGDQGDGNKVSANDQKVNELRSTVLSSVNSELVKAYVSGTSTKPACCVDAGEFDPIWQHRTFCPWIVAPDDGEHLPGWKLTLSALDQDKDSSHALLEEAQSTLSDEADDPITSLQKFFASPPSKRFKGTH